ncbi:MAG: nickel pincer cofactor biosynthesis protein LarC [Nitrospina sp.]|jgi:pyridinium-3,5-bisthiocarboxylic acid mononucleotide nickel chelatase|nr:nickel pincer cofactor biosynthesis protein LarC [Nitrospina sp.]
MNDKRVVYFDCFSGISGDMILGALVSLGIDIKKIRNHLKSLNLKGCKLNSRKVKRNGFIGTKVNVVLNHTSQKSHHSRSFNDIKCMIEKSDLPKIVQINSIAIFRRIGKVEAKVHGTTINKIHFHEVGAVDSIIDIVGGSLAMNLLDADLVVSSPINTGEGVVKCNHGILPVPAPATLELLKGIPCYSSGVEKELTTPTGAAFIGHFAEKYGSLPNIKVLNTGYGAGTHEIKKIPNLLRVVLGVSEESSHYRSMKVIETNIDDMNPEFYDYVIDQLFKGGAVDVFFTPINMKKNRPGILLSVITSNECFDSVVQVLLEKTSTLGVRHYDVDRVVLPRKLKIIMTVFGKVRVKIGGLDKTTRTISPEYEDCRKIALKKEIPIQRVYDEVLKAAWILEM